MFLAKRERILFLEKKMFYDIPRKCIAIYFQKNCIKQARAKFIYQNFKVKLIYKK